MNMSTFIKRHREEAGLTQEQLAEKMNVSTVAVQNWEKGVTKIDQKGKEEKWMLSISEKGRELLKWLKD